MKHAISTIISMVLAIILSYTLFATNIAFTQNNIDDENFEEDEDQNQDENQEDENQEDENQEDENQEDENQEDENQEDENQEDENQEDENQEDENQEDENQEDGNQEDENQANNGDNQNNNFEDIATQINQNQINRQNMIQGNGNIQTGTNPAIDQIQPTSQSGQNAAQGQGKGATANTANSEAGTLEGEQGESERAKQHFSSLMSGHPEGVYYIRSEIALVYEGPAPNNKIMAKLRSGDPIHVISFPSASWAKIGRDRYVSINHIASYGIRTRGLKSN